MWIGLELLKKKEEKEITKIDLTYFFGERWDERIQVWIKFYDLHEIVGKSTKIQYH